MRSTSEESTSNAPLFTRMMNKGRRYQIGTIAAIGFSYNRTSEFSFLSDFRNCGPTSLELIIDNHLIL